MRTAANDIDGHKKACKRPWLSNDSLEPLKYKLLHGLKETAELKRLNDVFKAELKRDKEAFYQALAKEAEDGLQWNKGSLQDHWQNVQLTPASMCCTNSQG